jgi:UDP-glucose 4-epimerase
VIEANIQAMLSNTNSGFYNIGTGISTSISELANLIIKLSSNNFNPIFKTSLEGDIKKSVASTVKVKDFLCWKSKIKLEDGLKKLFFI